MKPASQWSTRRIGDCCTVGDGAHASIARQNSGVMYLSSKNFKPQGLDLSKVEFISEADYHRHFKEHSKAITKPLLGDVLVGIIGSLGEPYVVRVTDRFGLSSSVAILRPHNNLLLPKYLYYWMRGDKFQSAVYGIKGGVAQSYLSLEMIRSLPVEFPNLDVQRRIVDILSVCDDLIENNTRRIKILEQMAQMLYREWFVNFRFPGHEKVKMVESELGLIPPGWSIEPIANVAEILGGGTPATGVPEYWENGNIDWYSPTDLTAKGSMFMFGSSKKITELGLKGEEIPRLWRGGSSSLTFTGVGF